MLQACLNGDVRGGAVPETADALARDVAAARALGVRHFHMHPRDATGAETLQPDDVDAALTAARAAAPDAAIGIGTGDWIAPGPAGRLADMACWSALPDYVSVNLNEPDAPQVMLLMAARGIGVEAGLWTAEDAARFCDLDLPAQTRILIEMPDGDAVDPEIDAILSKLAAARRPEPVLLHGQGRSTWPCLRRAARDCLSSRIGFEDCAHLPDGTPARDNAALIAAAAEIFDAAGRPLA